MSFLPNKELLFGIDEIDQVFIGKLPYGSTIIIAGEPGSGKTSFAARVAYKNMVKYSSKVLYINFNEALEPELLILHGLRNVYDLHGGESIARYTYECSLIYRQRGITTFRQVAQTSKDEYHPAIEYSDIVSRIEPKIETKYTIHVLKTVEKGTPGDVITCSDLKKCFGNLHIM